MQLVENGKFLGRTTQSWAKILGFYAVYYTFLACLIYFTVTQYSDSLVQPGKDVSSYINTRHDQPGAGVYPFNSFVKDGDDSVIQLSTSEDKNKGKNMNADYRTYTEEFLAKYTANSESAVVCENPEDVLTKTCKVANSLTLQQAVTNLEDLVKEQTPIFMFALNKNFKWEPINNNKKLADNNVPFVKNSVEAECFEATNDGARVENSMFDVELLGEKLIRPNHFPYVANDKGKEGDAVPYNKPFLVGKIGLSSAAQAEGKSIKQAWKLADKQTHKIFRCEFSADNVEKPVTGEKFFKAPASTQSWSNDLTKLGMGFTQFGFNYLD